MFKPMYVKNTVSLTTSVLILVWTTGFWAAESYAAQNLDLKLRLQPKQKHQLRIVKEETISQTVMGHQQDIQHTKTTDLGFEVERIDTDGSAWLKITYLTLKETSGSAAGQMEFDSEKPDAGGDNPFAPTYTAMIGQSFVMKVTPEGQIAQTKGIDEMYRRMAERIVESEDDLRKQRLKEKAQRAIERADRQYGSRDKRIDAVKKMIKNNPLFTEAMIMETVGEAIMPFSQRPVGIGDTWQGKRTLLSGMPVEVDCTYVLKETDQAIRTVEISSEFDLTDVPVSSKVGPSESTKVSMTGSYQGSAQIDRSSGWMIRKKVALKASGQMKMVANKQTPKAMIIPMSIESVVTVEPVEQKSKVRK